MKIALYIEDGREQIVLTGEPQPTELSALLEEAAANIRFLRKQSRGHFEAMSVVLRDGVEALMPETPPKKAN